MCNSTASAIMLSQCCCCRSGPGSKDSEASNTPNGTQSRPARQQPSKSQSSAAETEADQLVQRASSTGLEPASHDHLAAVNSSANEHAFDVAANALGQPTDLQQPSDASDAALHSIKRDHDNSADDAGQGTYRSVEQAAEGRETNELGQAAPGPDEPHIDDDVESLSDIDLQDALGTDFLAMNM